MSKAATDELGIGENPLLSGGQGVLFTTPGRVSATMLADLVCIEIGPPCGPRRSDACTPAADWPWPGTQAAHKSRLRFARARHAGRVLDVLSWAAKDGQHRCLTTGPQQAL